MKHVNFLILSGLLFTVFLAGCKKETEKRSDPQSSEPKYDFPATLLRKAQDYAFEKGYAVINEKDSLLFIDYKDSPVPTDTVYNKYSDSIAREIVKNVYVEYVEKLPEGWYESNVHYYSLSRGYYYTISTYYENGTYHAYYTYYSESGKSKGMPHGNNPFSFTTQYMDTVLKKYGRIYRGYDPADRKKFPL